MSNLDDDVIPQSPTVSGRNHRKSLPRKSKKTKEFGELFDVVQVYYETLSQRVSTEKEDIEPIVHCSQVPKTFPISRTTSDPSDYPNQLDSINKLKSIYGSSPERDTELSGPINPFPDFYIVPEVYKPIEKKEGLGMNLPDFVPLSQMPVVSESVQGNIARVPEPIPGPSGLQNPPVGGTQKYLDEEDSIFLQISTESYDPHKFSSPERKKLKLDEPIVNSPDILLPETEKFLPDNPENDAEVDLNKTVMLDLEEEHLGASPMIKGNIDELSKSFDENSEESSQKSTSEGKINFPQKRKHFVDVQVVKRSFTDLSQKEAGPSRKLKYEEDKCDFPKSPTCSNKKTTAPKRLFREAFEAKNQPDKSNIPLENHLPELHVANPEPFCGGFIKANMKKVHISEDTLKKAQAVFGDIGDFAPIGDAPGFHTINFRTEERQEDNNAPSEAPKGPEDFPNEPLRILENRPVNLPLGNPQSFSGGFQMANMKKVTISEDALKRVQMVFADLGDFAPLDDACGFHKINMGAEKSVEKIEVSKEDGDTELVFLRNLDDETFDQMFGENAMFTQNLLNAIENPKIPDPIEEVSLAEDVRIGRESAAKLQEEFAVEKAKDYVEIFKSDFIEKKLTPSRHKLRDFVAGGYPGKFSEEELIGFGVKGATMSLNWKNCLEMEFDLCDFFEENELAVNIAGFSLDHFTVIPNLRNRLGFYEISRAFRASRGINPHALLEGWLENAWRFIVLKFAAMECAFPAHFGGQLLTPKNLLHHLHYRYFREIVLGQNSALKKIMELEESPKKTLVLFVLDVIDEGIILLSDGWYKIPGKLDAALAERLKLGKICVGTKLITQGCNLLNCDREYSPLKIPPNVMLELHGNSTRRCRWDTKLGFFARLRPKCVPLDSVLYNGGLIPRIVVCFIRVYPAIYIESFRERRKRPIVRSERAEKRYCDRMSSKCFDNFENMYNKVQEEFLQQNNDRNISIRNITNISCIRDPEELNCLLKYSYDPESVENEMTGSQKEMVRQHLAKLQEKRYQEIAECVRKRLRQQKLERRVKKLLQIRVVDAKRPGKSVMLNFWLPSDEFSSVLKEGDIFELTSCTAREIRNGDIFVDGPRIEDGDQNVRKLDSSLFPMPPLKYNRRITTFNELPTRERPEFIEFDIIGVVVKIEHMKENRKFEQVFLADAQKNLLRVSFWKGLSNFAYDDIVTLRAVLCFGNLQWRPSNSLPQLAVSELTVITENPKSEGHQKTLEELRQSLSGCNIQEFIEECMAKL